jgi:hypothetical protein
VTIPAIVKWASVYLAILLGCSAFLLHAFALHRDGPGTGTFVISDWNQGKRVARQVVSGQGIAELQRTPPENGSFRTIDEIVDEGPLLGRSQLLFGASFSPGQDGMKAIFRGRTAILTPDDLLTKSAYQPEYSIGRASLLLGVARDAALTAIADELQVSRFELLAEAQFRRLAFKRRSPASPPTRELTRENLDASIFAASQYLANQVKVDGSFRYEIDPFTNQDMPGYSWPRHAGATWFLAQAAQHTHARRVGESAKLAAMYMIESASLRCGTRRCIGDGNEPNVGSSALGLLAIVELVETGLAPELARVATELADFIRSQQRPDGEFMHVFDIAKGQPIDIQQAYYTGEAALALSHAHRITRDPRDLDAAERALAFLVYRPFWAIGMHYIWGTEHWTCQAMQDLWQRVPNPKALEFCMEWQSFNRSQTVREGDFAGVAATDPYVAVRFTPTASRMEAAVATLEAARLADLPAERVDELEQGLRRSLRLLLNVQFVPGPSHLMQSPLTMHGGFPGGSVDQRVRIDYPQHAGSALLHYRKLLGN